MKDERLDDLKIGLPQWARLFLHVYFPTAVAMILLAAMLGWVPSPIMERLSRIEYQAWQQTMIMRTICYGLSAKVDRQGCEPWQRQPVQ